MKKLLPFFFLLFISGLSIAQTVFDNNPTSLKWYQVNTPHFRVLFPKGFEDQAQRMANTLEFIHDDEAKSLGSLPQKISVILQNQTSVSNGFVSMLPRRSEFYGMPPQDYNYTGTNDWLNMLATHEYRHIVQYQHAKRGFNKALYYLFGSTTFAGMSQAAAPMWFWEGDAVATETAFTHSGRGKIPNFGITFRSNILEGRTFNYHKQYLRSYKHFIPDHYVLGYHMVSYLRKRTNDPQIWGKITARSWNVPFIPFAFSSAIKRETGLYVTDLYREMAKDLKSEWEKDLAKLELTPFELISKRSGESFTDFSYPQVMEDGSVIAMQKGIGDIETFVQIKNGKIKKIFRPGIFNDAGMLSSEGNKIFWIEHGYNVRWNVKNYSLIKSFDIDKHKRKVIGGRKGRFGSVAASSKADKVVAVQTSTNYKTKVVVLDVKTGDVIKEFPNEKNYFYSMPRWMDDGSKIVLLKTSGEGKTISIIDFTTGVETDLLPFSDENYGHPVPFGDYVLYNSPRSGIDNIYALKISSGEKLQVTSSRYGAYNPSVSPDGKYIYYNDQTKNGLDVVRVAFDPSLWRQPESEKLGIDYDKVLVEQEGNEDLFKNIPQQKLPVKKYSKLKGVINPYTWGFNLETDLTQASVGIVSRDLLSTTSINLGYAVDINERTGAWKGQVSYQALFPIIDLSVSLAKRKVNEGNWNFERIVNDDTLSFSRDLVFEWEEKSVVGGFRIPITLTRSKYLTGLSISNDVGYSNITKFTNSITGEGRVIPVNPETSAIFREYADNGNLVYNHFNLTLNRLMKTSYRDINSKWGQRLIVNAYSTPYGGDFVANQLSAYSLLYFPGFVKHHSIWGYGAYQYTDLINPATPEGLRNYTFRNGIPLPRGLSFPRLEHFYTASINYTLPVWYPDIALGPILNIQRLRANVFYDYGYLTSDIVTFSEQYASTGIELKVDINVMRFFPQFDLGIRFTRGLSPSLNNFEVLIGTFNF